MVVHYVTIALENLDIQDGETRQQLSDDLGRVVCPESEDTSMIYSFPAFRDGRLTD